MTLVNPETGELVEVMTESEARSITSRIRSLAESIADRIDLLVVKVREAQAGHAHVALGYPSWTRYVEVEFAGMLPRLDREPRRELVTVLAETGMSTRAIAPVVGVDQATVVRDLAGDAPASPDVTGRDGKTYSRPTPASVPVAEPQASRPPARRPLPDAFFDAAYDLSKSVDRVVRLADDDRFPQNAEKVAAKHRSDLIRARDALAGVIARMS